MGFWSNIFGKGGSYFLDDESAKGLGDTEYMKQVKAVRRTFPGAAGEEEFEMTRQVSAMDKTVFDSRKDGVVPVAKPSYNTASSSSFGSANSFGASSFGGGSSFGGANTSTEAEADVPAPKEPSFQPSRTTNVDTGMDMFRDMAKKVGR